MFAPSIFYQMYGSYEMKCKDCTSPEFAAGADLSSPHLSWTPLLNSHQTIFVDCHSGLVCSIRLWVIFHFTNPRILDLGNYVSRTKTRRLFQIKQCCQHEHTNPNTKTHHPITGQARRPRWRPRRTQLVKIEIYNHIAWGNNFICHYRRNPSRQRGLHLGRFPHKPQILGTNGFALVPNTTEFLNAISFAVGGNVALSLEIGSAYALQVVLIQIPCLVLYSIYQNFENVEQTFTLIFPRWDIIATLISIYLFTYIYAEGKSNYFKGVILILIYVVVLSGFWFNDIIDSI